MLAYHILFDQYKATNKYIYSNQNGIVTTYYTITIPIIILYISKSKIAVNLTMF